MQYPRKRAILDVVGGAILTIFMLSLLPTSIESGSFSIVLLVILAVCGALEVFFGIQYLANASETEHPEGPFESPEQNMVAEFHERFGHPVADRPTEAEDQDDLRIRLMQEELDEFKEAVEKKDFVKQADAIADLLYVTYGTAVVKGLDTYPLFEEAHRSNMSKLGDDGLPILADGSDPLVPKGKVLKGQGYFEADFAGEIERQRR